LTKLYLSFIFSFRTLSKISLSGSTNVVETLKQEIPQESIPTTLGGTFGSFYEPFEFDVSESGPFYVSAEDMQLLTERAGERSHSGEGRLSEKTRSLLIDVNSSEDRSRREVDKVLQQVLTAIVIESSLRKRAAGDGQVDGLSSNAAPTGTTDEDSKSFQYTDVFICDDWDGGSPAASGYDSDFSSPFGAGSSNFSESPFMNNPLLRRKLFDSIPADSAAVGNTSNGSGTRLHTSLSSVEMIYHSLRSKKVSKAPDTPIQPSSSSPSSSSSMMKRLSGRKQAVSVLEAIDEDRNEESNPSRAALLRIRICSDILELLCILVEDCPLLSSLATLVILLLLCGYPTAAKIITPFIFIYSFMYGLS